MCSVLKSNLRSISLSFSAAVHLGDRKNQVAGPKKSVTGTWTSKHNVRTPSMKPCMPAKRLSPALRKCSGPRRQTAQATPPQKQTASKSEPMETECDRSSATPDRANSNAIPDHANSSAIPDQMGSTNPQSTKKQVSDIRKTIRDLKEERPVGKKDRVNLTVKQNKEAKMDELTSKRNEKREKKLQAHRSKPPAQQADFVAQSTDTEKKAKPPTDSKERIRPSHKSLDTLQKNKDNRMSELDENRKQKRLERLQAARNAVRKKKEEIAAASTPPEDDSEKARKEAHRVLKAAEEAEKKRAFSDNNPPSFDSSNDDKAPTFNPTNDGGIPTFNATTDTGTNAKDNDRPSFDSSNDDKVPTFNTSENGEVPILDTTTNTGSNLVYDAIVKKRVEPKVWDESNFAEGPDDEEL